MTLVVTGGAGFIGVNFIKFVQQNHPDVRVVCIDKLTYAGNIKNLHKINAWKNSDAFKFYKDDICDKERIGEIFRVEKPDAVINFAAESHVTHSITCPSKFIQTNVIGTQVLLDACLNNGVTRFHQISTDEVYGTNTLSTINLGFTESSLLNPSTPYAASKASADLVVQSYYKTYGLHTTITRSSNNYGPYQHVEKLIPLTISNLLNGNPCEIHGDGRHLRDWIYVDSHCDGVWKALECGEPGEIYNISSGIERTTLEIVEFIGKYLNIKPELVYVPDRLGNDTRYKMNNQKAQAILHWSNNSTLSIFEENLKHTIDHYHYPK